MPIMPRQNLSDLIGGRNPATPPGGNLGLSAKTEKALHRDLKRRAKVRRMLASGTGQLVPYVQQGYRSSGAVAFLSSSAYLFGSAGVDATLGVSPGSFLKVTGVFESVLASGAQATGIFSGVNLWVNGVQQEGGQTIMTESRGAPGAYSLGYVFHEGGTSLRVQAVGHQPSGEVGYAWAEVFPSIKHYLLFKAMSQGNMGEIESALDLFIDDDIDDTDEG